MDTHKTTFWDKLKQAGPDIAKAVVYLLLLLIILAPMYVLLTRIRDKVTEEYVREIILALGSSVVFACVVIWLADAIGVQAIRENYSRRIFQILIVSMLLWAAAYFAPASKKSAGPLPPQPSSRDLSFDHFGGGNKFADIKTQYSGKARAVVNTVADKVVYLHYIREKYQLGLHAYFGVKNKNRTREGAIPIFVRTREDVSVKDIDYIEWRSLKTTSELRSRTLSPGEDAYSVKIADGQPEHFSTVHYFEDELGIGASDFFLSSLQEFHDPNDNTSMPVDFYVIVDNQDLCRWNPNKYVLDVREIGTEKVLSFSNAVYRTYPIDSPETADARELLARVLSVPTCRTGRCDNFNKVQSAASQLMKNGRLAETVTVFKSRSRPSDVERALIYKFHPGPSIPCP